MTSNTAGPTPPLADEVIRALERAELEACRDVFLGAGADVVADAGISSTELDGFAVLVANRVDVLAINRVIGLGLSGPVSDDALSRLIATIERCGSPRFFLPVAPVEGHERLVAQLDARGLRHYNNWIRLWRRLDDLPELEPTGLVIREVDGCHGDEFGRIVANAFGYPPAILPLAGQTTGRPQWRHYLAYEERTPIAAAAMYIAGAAVWFGFAATDAAYRKRGAQRALVIRRLHDAAAMGCSWVSVETAEDTAIRDAPSFRNLRRLGFEVAYTRPNHLWSAPQ